jgi:hypothetical protein
VGWREALEARMTTRAFKKVMAGLDDARAYLDGTADKRRYRVNDCREGKTTTVAGSGATAMQDSTSPGDSQLSTALTGRTCIRKAKRK